MALIFPRIANNFLKNGYYPTDVSTLERICSALDTTETMVRALDPCCGEGAALLEVKSHLAELGGAVQAFGIEVDEERAWHAKSVLDTVAHADVHDVRVSERAFGLLFLNPPYGDLVTDQVASGDPAQGRQRHEKIFCRRSFTLLQPDGVLVLIVPFYVIDAELATLIARHFDQVQVFMAPEQQFKQCVLFGIKRRPAPPDSKLLKRLLAFAAGEDQQELPMQWTQAPYAVPGPRAGSGAGDEFAFTVVRLDARQLDAELQAGLSRSSLWPRFDQHLMPRARDAKPPLRAMTDWHLALALAAGQISGLVTSQDGRRLLIKGRTHKVKDTAVSFDTGADGSVSETRVLTDKFVTVIRALDMTPGPNLGQIVTIQ